jgi:hypothetical protein
MEGQREEDEITAHTDNVVDLFGHRVQRRAEPQATDDELTEYRKWRPAIMLLARHAPDLIGMLQEMDKLKSATGCPIMHDILGRP